MGQNFLPCDREQQLLMPPSLRDWLPADHLAWFVLDAVGELDLAEFFADYRADGHGRAAHDPRMMVALVLYAYAVGERSARLIERRLHEDVAYRVIAANQVPDHATIARFRVRHEQALAGLFSSVLALCARAGLVRAGVVALDGTKLQANASGQANMTYEQIAKAIIEDAARVDAEEDERFGDRRGDELPAELADPVTRKQRLRAAKLELEAEWEAERQAAEAHNARCQEHAQARAEGRPKPGRRDRGPDHRRGRGRGRRHRPGAARADDRPDRRGTRGSGDRPADRDAARRRRLLERETDQGAPRPGDRRVRHPGRPQTTPAAKTAARPGAARPARDRRRPGALPQTRTDDRARLRPDQDQPPRRPLPTKRPARLPVRMAADHRDPQPAQALAPRPHPGAGDLNPGHPGHPGPAAPKPPGPPPPPRHPPRPLSDSLYTGAK